MKIQKIQDLNRRKFTFLVLMTSAENVGYRARAPGVHDVGVLIIGVKFEG